MAAQHGGEWTASVAPGRIKLLGILELLAVAGLILPVALDVAPVMVPVTALLWVVLMVGAMVTHGRLGQYGLIGVNAVHLGLAVFVAAGRLAS
ncbi:DoxX family protein [Streptomyces sp. VRA16 Mangrove soil]|uniref:DoxX family protein n=1 Tax=Streptomyces sp. VRA16 Mangrove soil TaxID=2817434 RepID=UPI001E382E2D|nr:DoxX family protein [Streptomyces sp. VRA16 Mangrove soil]